MRKLLFLLATAVFTVFMTTAAFAAGIMIESAKYLDDGSVKVVCSLTGGSTHQELTVIAYEADTDLKDIAAISENSYKNLIHIDQITADVNNGKLEFAFAPASWIDRGKTYIVSVGGADIEVSDKMIISVDSEGTMTFILGDTDGDDQISAADATYVLQKALTDGYSLPIQSRSEDWFKYADVDGDGSLTATDAALILQKTLLETFPFPAESSLG